MENQPDLLTLKLRTTLFEIRKKGCGKIRTATAQGPLLGVTIMTNRYKSKRRLQLCQNQKSHRQNDENSLKTEIFKRMVLGEHRPSNGLDIQRAVMHGNQPKKLRISTQRSFEQHEQNSPHHFSKDSLFKRLNKHRKVLQIHHNQDMRNTVGKFSHRAQYSERPLTANTHSLLFKPTKGKTRSMEMQAPPKIYKHEELEGWKVENVEDFDFM